MRVAQEEIFGPVLTVIPFADEKRSARARERRALRPGRLSVDERRRPRASLRALARGRHGVGQLREQSPSADAVRRHEGERHRPRRRRLQLRFLHGNEERLRRAWHSPRADARPAERADESLLRAEAAVSAEPRPRRAQALRRGPGALLDEYELTAEERAALESGDIGLLYVMGVNGQILMHYAALLGQPWDVYINAMRDGVRKHGPVRAGLYSMLKDRSRDEPRVRRRLQPCAGHHGACSARGAARARRVLREARRDARAPRGREARCADHRRRRALRELLHEQHARVLHRHGRLRTRADRGRSVARDQAAARARQRRAVAARSSKRCSRTSTSRTPRSGSSITASWCRCTSSRRATTCR